MKTGKVVLVYFTATDTTLKVMNSVVEQLDADVIMEFNVTTGIIGNPEEVNLSENDVLLVGAPVYSGRIPEIAAREFAKFKGKNTPAVIAAVYGNRAYDDALLELADLVKENGFNPVAAGAFVAEHSIFPQVATNRPDTQDIEKIEAFGRDCKALLESIEDINAVPELEIPGNRPYKEAKRPALHPVANDNCVACGQCVDECPAGAISCEDPRITNFDLCISCGRCIGLCPNGGRGYEGDMYMMGGAKFAQANGARKEPEFFFPKL